MSIVPLLLSFAFLPDNTPLPVSFQVGGFALNALSATPTPLVNETGGEKGYQFPNQGVEVSLPATVSVVDIRACSFAQPVKVEALEHGGFVTDFADIASNSCTDLKLHGTKINELRFTGGGNEGLIVSLNIAIAACNGKL